MTDDPNRPNNAPSPLASGIPENVVTTQSDQRTAPTTNPPATNVPPKDVVVAPRKWLPSFAAKEWADFASKCFAIAAFGLGALWAAFVFIETVAPGLEPKLNVTGDISWTPATRSDVCEGHFSLVVRNPEPGSVDVHTARVKVWVEDLSSTVDENGKSVLQPSGDWATTLEKKQITGDEGSHTERPTKYESTEVEPLMADIRTHYPPGVENSSSQIFFFQKIPDTFTLIEVILDGQGYKTYPFGRQDVHNWGYAMDRVCGPPEKEKSEPSVDKSKPKKAAAPIP
jgi:hypothetical protein